MRPAFLSLPCDYLALTIKRYIRLTELLPALLEGDIKVGNSNVGRATIIGTLI